MKRTFPIALAALLFAGGAVAENCTIDLDGNDQMKFDKSEVTVSAARRDHHQPEPWRQHRSMPRATTCHTETGDYMPVFRMASRPVWTTITCRPTTAVIAHTDVISGGDPPASASR